MKHSASCIVHNTSDMIDPISCRMHQVENKMQGAFCRVDAVSCIVHNVSDIMHNHIVHHTQCILHSRCYIMRMIFYMMHFINCMTHDVEYQIHVAGCRIDVQQSGKGRKYPSFLLQFLHQAVSPTRMRFYGILFFQE
jgi:hypothetical protein